MDSGMTIAITPRMVINQCARCGVPQQELLDAIGISRDCLRDPSGRVPITKMYALWEHAIQLTHDRMLALHTAEAVPFGTYRLLDYLFAASSTPGNGLWRSSQWFGVMNNSFTLSFSVRGNTAYLELYNAIDPKNIPRPYVEYLFATFLVRLRFITQVDWKPAEIHVTYPNPSADREYERLFRAPVRFRQAANRMIVPRNLTEMPQPLADPELCELLEDHARKQMQDPSRGRQRLADIQHALAGNLDSGNISLPFLARKLAKSCRNLQREIQAAGLTFRELLDSVRQKRAIALLQDHEPPFEEVAMKLQFSSASSFCHAFHRWTGQSPREYRGRLQTFGSSRLVD
jgi:AraC-like DNA-binding protein